jgi:hypothetical protein
MIIKSEVAPAGGMVHQGILNLIRQNVSKQLCFLSVIC